MNHHSNTPLTRIFNYVEENNLEPMMKWSDRSLTTGAISRLSSHTIELRNKINKILGIISGDLNGSEIVPMLKSLKIKPVIFKFSSLIKIFLKFSNIVAKANL